MVKFLYFLDNTLDIPDMETSSREIDVEPYKNYTFSVVVFNQEFSSENNEVARSVSAEQSTCHHNNMRCPKTFIC